jgi:hypothetical protein
VPPKSQTCVNLARIEHGEDANFGSSQTFVLSEPNLGLEFWVRRWGAGFARMISPQEETMRSSTKFLLAAAAIVVVSALPYSVSVSKQSGITITSDQAHAIIGRPLTPYSFAGARRRAIRRGYYGYYGYARPYLRPGCVWVRGVRVCR